MGGKQLGLSDCELTTTRKQTKQEKFLFEIEVVVPRQALIDLIETNTKDQQERRPTPVPTGNDAADPPVTTVVFA
jgi:hypothetical protein